MERLTSTENPADLADEEVLQRSKQEPWLFALLVDRYEAAFLRKVKAIIRDPRDCEEVVLDAFTKIYVHSDSFAPQTGAKFSSWAYRILLNTSFTRYQKLIKEGQRFIVFDPEFEQLVGERAGHTGFDEKLDGVERILARLPGHFAYVLRLHYLERWSHEDIAKSTGENIGTIKTRIHRAKAAFRQEGKDEEIEVLL